jgi:hypothetical protein
MYAKRVETLCERQYFTSVPPVVKLAITMWWRSTRGSPARVRERRWFLTLCALVLIWPFVMEHGVGEADNAVKAVPLALLSISARQAMRLSGAFKETAINAPGKPLRY